MKRSGFVVVLFIILLFSGCGTRDNGAGYQSLYQLGDTCYLTDDSGVIYTLDLVTGEKELYGKPPVSLHWVADPSLSCIYYMKEDNLCRYTFSTETEDVICALPECDRIYAATEDYVLYIEALIPDGEQLSVAYICSLNLSTLESRRETDVWGNLIGTASGNLVFTADILQTPSEEGATPNDLWTFGAKDLDTGEVRILLEDQQFLPFEHQIAVIDDTLYFILNSTVYAMPVTGGEMVPISPYANNLKLAPCEGSGILAASYGPDDTAVWYYDHRAAAATTLCSVPAVKSMASDGTRYAILTQDFGQGSQIILGDLPTS